MKLLPAGLPQQSHGCVASYRPDTFSRRITTDDPATTGSAVTHYGMYNAAALAGDALLYDNAKSGTLPDVDVNGDPINWGVGGVIGAADALAAFGQRHGDLD